MTKVVLDASALFALREEEKGADKVMTYLDRAVMSVVNYTETLTLLLRDGHNIDEADNIIKSVLVDIIDFDPLQAKLAAVIRHEGKHCGISLGDSACLALATQLKSSVVTADTVWKKLKLDLDIVLIR
jgi:PIN domain nuclease of toxin-antitoxin system